METHSVLQIGSFRLGWYSILFYHKEVEFCAQTLIIPFDILQYATFDYVPL